MASHSSLGRAGLSTLYDTPKAANKARARITHEVAKKNYLNNDDSDEDDDNADEEGYEIDPSVQLFKSIDFGRNKGNNASANSFGSNNSSFHVNKKDSVSRSTLLTEKSKPSNEVNPALQGSNSVTLLSNGKSKTFETASASSHPDDSFKLEPDMSSNERDSLIDALEKMRKQNEALARQVTKTQQESRAQIEQERNERVNAVTRMQAENDRLTQSLMNAQRDAEAALNIEKEKLRNALRAMENEKNELMNKIKFTEEHAREEYFRLQYMQAEQQRKIGLLEEEKTGLMQQMRVTEEQMKRSHAANSASLSVEREKLMQRINEMEVERSETVKSLQLAQSQTEMIQEQMNRQLEQERQELRASMERMEAEKISLTATLANREKELEARANALENQLNSDRKDLTDAINRIESDRELLIAKYQQSVESETESTNSRVTSEIQSARMEMQAQLENMIKEKEELARKLKATEEAAAERLRLEAEKQANEKKELLEAVQRMKAEIASSGGSSASNGNSMVSPRSSLFGMMENDTSSSKGNSATKGNKSRFINSIPEDEEGEGFMNLDDEDEENEKGDRFGSSGDESGKNVFADLPAPHEAAALGDLARLQILAGLEPSLLQSVDASSRSPLFYAAAYGHTEVAKYLAEANPIMVTSPDSHGDTPLHAAASGGRAETLQLLLQSISEFSGNANLQPRNHLGMTPMHMACSAECMECLYMYGADITATDDQGRSPLFVACAMNRDSCAEFLVTSLDQIEQSILLKDLRGDTPLHAAACNGSVECLLLLLQFGIDPRVTNDKGLKAIDLAIKNKQKQCRKLLAEYHLHYGTSSDFDSVLFLATLEGHKAAKAKAPPTPYQIIKKSSFTGSGGSVGPADAMGGGTHGGLTGSSFKLPKGKSMFSLNSDRSLRLQRWGNWIAYEDQTAKSVYWYNPSTGTGQWDKPEEVANIQQLMGSNSSHSASSRLFANKMSMRLKRVGDWIQYVTESGPTFYYNDKNGEFQWVDPSKEDPDKKGDVDLGDWKPYKDPQSGNIFWYNKVTKISQWECPLESIPPELLLQDNSATSSPEKEKAEDYSAIEVDHEDDLGI